MRISCTKQVGCGMVTVGTSTALKRISVLLETRSRRGASCSNLRPPLYLALKKRRNICMMSSEEKKKEEVIVQYVVLRRDLIDTWPLGSVVTQGCHASVAAVWENKEDPHTLDYCSPTSLHTMHKVTLEVKGEAQLVKLSDKLNSGGILHKLWIEQPENFPTCLATKPYPKSLISSFFKSLKLCN